MQCGHLKLGDITCHTPANLVTLRAQAPQASQTDALPPLCLLPSLTLASGSIRRLKVQIERWDAAGRMPPFDLAGVPGVTGVPGVSDECGTWVY
jgi:hypothetical protein